MISIRNVSKRFGPQVVLDRVSLEIEAGKATAIVGPSGVGKSVLLKLIMGIMDPDEGEILVCGENITRARSEHEKNEIRAQLGVLFQSAALFDSLTVYENIAFPVEQRFSLAKEQVHKKVIDTACSLSLERYLLSYPEEIPMGVRKRVGLARALIMEPSIFLFDEPNTGLDPVVGQEVYDLINHCRERWGFTGVVISHEIPEVFQVVDRVAMLLGGRVIECCSPEEFIRTSNLAVQQFMKGLTDGPIKIQ
ncbi:MAG: ATP-binding cassette domain-containing protein [Bdellovibrionota bacterium]|nr:MAG: ATP-binding cassette domain-containing protein [Bdellovibrionota bacterium]